MSSTLPDQSPGLGVLQPPARAKRYKVSLACDVCRLRKLKCDGVRPACTRCRKKDPLRPNCKYSARAESRHSLTSCAPAGAGPSPQVSLSCASMLKTSDEAAGVDAAGFCYASGNLGDTGFVTEVKRVIDARLGLPFLNKKPCPAPMINSPLFGSLPLRHTADPTGSVHVDGLLPPRRHADRLMDIYWRCLHPLEPVLDRERFSCSYEALYAGSDLAVDERVFISTVNTVLALATQRQESAQPAEQRNEAAKAFFHRAWALLRPEAAVWEPGSLELVQCMLLMCRFTQCTDNQLTTWMLMGSAVRTAQSLGLHLPDTSVAGAPSRDAWWRRRIWLHCAYMDREISWTVNRTSTVPLAASSSAIDSIHSDVQLLTDAELGAPTRYLIKTLELQEITSHIMLSQVQASSRFAESLGLPPSRQSSDLSAAVAMDNCLKKWARGLPPALRSDSAADPDDIEPGTIGQRVLLHLRLAHARTLLFRPMLAQFCLASQSPPSSSDQSLGQRILRDCASLCVDSSRRVIDLVHDHHHHRSPLSPTDPNPNAAGVLPWWNRIFYLFVASQHLLAAMLRPDDAFQATAADALDKALSALRAQEYLSPCVGRCVKSFETMRLKIADIHRAGGEEEGVEAAVDGAAAAVASTSFQDVFQDLGFDAGSWPLGMEDMASWFGTEGWGG